MKEDPHKHAERLRTILRKIEANEYGFRKEHRRAILDFYLHLRSEGLTDCRIYKYLCTLKLICERVDKPFEKMTVNDVKKLVIELESTQLSEWTKHDYKVTIRTLFKWLKGSNERLPDEVSWIKVRVRERHKLPEDLLTEDEFKKMVANASNPRDKALLECLFESGCRIGELLTVQLKNIRFDEYGAVMRITGKTGSRRVRLIAAVQSLVAWIELHPLKGNPDAYLFIRKQSKANPKPVMFSYSYARKIIKKLARMAGIKKRVHPHLFRHSRATALANKLTEAQMKEYFGWVQGSDIASIYVHLSGRDVDNAILGLYGLRKPEENGQSGFRPIICPRCDTTSSPASKLCPKCGYALSVDVILNDEHKSPIRGNLLASLMKDPQFKELLLKKVLEIEGG